jgi:hypothetical protein
MVKNLDPGFRPRQLMRRAQLVWSDLIGVGPVVEESRSVTRSGRRLKSADARQVREYEHAKYCGGETNGTCHTVYNGKANFYPYPECEVSEAEMVG